MRCFDQAISMCEKAIRKILMFPRINGLQSLLYHIAWNAFEAAANVPEEYKFLRLKWRKALQISKIMADFMLDSYLIQFLDERTIKYLS